MLMASGVLGAEAGWVSWVVLAVVLAAFWAIPIAGTLALFRPGQPVVQRKRRHRQCS